MKKIAILTGGPGYEREVALKSVKLFEKYIQREYTTFTLPEDLDAFIQSRKNFELVIPVFHGEYGEDGKIQAMLDIFQIPYIGSSSFTHALCMNKRETNIVVKSFGIALPQEQLFRNNQSFSLDSFHLSFPVIVKPNTGGSSCYTYKVQTIEELEEKVKYIQKNIPDDILVQEYISGEEYSVSVVNGEVLDAIMKLEKNTPDAMFDFESKYENDSQIQETFPKIEPQISKGLKQATKEIIEKFNILGYARIDFIVSHGIPYFLEVNTIPGSTEVSILPKAWTLSGRSLEDFIETLIVSVKK